jgi:hypothetical protein
MGFLTGFREDLKYRVPDECSNIDYPVGFLDNNFHNPDLDRYLERFEKYDPSVAVVGDAYTEEDAEKLNSILEDLEKQSPFKTLIAVPKSRGAAETLDDDWVLGFPNGYSDITADDLGYDIFRGEDTHILGGAPDSQYNAIRKLTQPDLLGNPPAEVKGVDYNGFMRPAFAEPGEYWTPNGWEKDFLHSEPRDTIQKSLKQVKDYWQSKELWPEQEPREIHGPAVEEPTDMVYALSGDDIQEVEDLETAVVDEYDGWKLAFKNETNKDRFEYREGIEGVIE